MSNERILVVDDEKTILELGRRFLVSEGFDVEIASQGMQAMKLLEEDPDEPTLAQVLDSLGVVYTIEGNHTNALRSLKRSAEIFRRIEDHDGLIETLLHLSEFYESIDSILKARSLAQEAKELAYEMEDEGLIEETESRIQYLARL